MEIIPKIQNWQHCRRMEVSAEQLHSTTESEQRYLYADDEITTDEKQNPAVPVPTNHKYHLKAGGVILCPVPAHVSHQYHMAKQFYCFRKDIKENPA